MPPRVKPLAIAAPPFCLWKPSTTALAGVLLLLYNWKAWLKVADPLKDVLALTSKVLLLLVPMVALPKAVKVLPVATLTGALKLTGAVKLENA